MSQATNSSHSSGADTRRRILVAAVELFSRNGYAGTSVRDIAEALGMTKASLYYHFAGKEEILAAVTAPLRDDMVNLVRWASEPPRPGPSELLTALVAILSRGGPLLSSMFGDPSMVQRHLPKDTPRDGMAVIEAILAESSEPAALLRARCAIGALLAGVSATAIRDARFIGPTQSGLADRLLDLEEELLDEEQQREVVAAALRALGRGEASMPATSRPHTSPSPRQRA